MKRSDSDVKEKKKAEVSVTSKKDKNKSKEEKNKPDKSGASPKKGKSSIKFNKQEPHLSSSSDSEMEIEPNKKGVSKASKDNTRKNNRSLSEEEGIRTNSDMKSKKTKSSIEPQQIKRKKQKDLPTAKVVSPLTPISKIFFITSSFVTIFNSVESVNKTKTKIPSVSMTRLDMCFLLVISLKKKGLKRKSNPLNNCLALQVTVTVMKKNLNSLQLAKQNPYQSKVVVILT